MKSLYLLLPLIFIVAGCKNVNFPEKNESTSLPLESIQLPEGFTIDIYAEGVINARSMSLSPNGTLFVGTRSEGSVYALQDLNNDFKIDTMYTLLTDATLPNGVAFKNGDLYVAEVNRIIKYSDIENNLSEPGEPEVIYDQYPTIEHHGWKFISFGPDGKLYVPVGAPCNICESDDQVFNTITRMNADGSDFEIVQEGVRNTVGFTWHPETKNLWFTDNGRDHLGEDLPACELNHATSDQQHFGYPYCHQGDTPDPDFGSKRNCNEFIAPVQNLGAHVAPLGCEFYTASMFPEKFKQMIFIAEHGSWNREKKSGYKISLVEIAEDQSSKAYTDFATGWLDDESDDVWGRPVDIEWMPDGSMLVSDDFADVIYRISYKG